MAYGYGMMNMMGLGAFAGMMAAFLFVFLILLLAVYIYSSFALMTVANKLGTQNSWLAWIPIGNLVLMANMAQMHWWPVLLIIGSLIPFVGWIFGLALTVFVIIWMWKICERRGRPGWFAAITVISIIPVIGILGGIWALILLGILAWGDNALTEYKTSKANKSSSAKATPKKKKK